ncbi:MAG: O-antigen ligase family protein [Candidatus Omnitrophota bacterium]
MTETVQMSSKKIKKKSELGFYLMFLAIILVFSFIVAKDVSLPRAVTLPIILFGLVALFMSSLKSPYVPFFILLCYLPFNNVLIGRFGSSSGLNLTNIFILLTSGAWFLESLTKKRKVFASCSLNFPIILFSLLGLGSLIFASMEYGYHYDFGGYFIVFKRWLTPIFLFFIALNVVKDKKGFQKSLFIMLMITALIGLMAIRDYINYPDKRAGGVFLQPNYMGAFFSYNMFFFLSFFLYYYRNFKYWLMLIPFLICFRGIMVSFSRGAYVACALGGIATTFFRSKMLFIASVVVLIFAVSNPDFLPSGIRERMSKTYSGDQVFSTDLEEVTDLSATKRIEIWKGAIEMIKEKPWTGFGYGTFQDVIGQYTRNVGKMDAHNTYLIIAAESGIPTLLSFLLILFVGIKNGWWLLKNSNDRFFKAFALGFLGGMFALLAANMFGSRLNAESVGSYSWVFLGLIMRAVIMKKNGEIE